MAEKVLVESDILEKTFQDEFYGLMTALRITKEKRKLFEDIVEKCKCVLSKHELTLLAKNGKTLKRFRSMFSNLNACIVLLLISKGEYNVKLLAKKFEQVPNNSKSEPHSVVEHWVKELRNQNLIQRSECSEGKENVYEYYDLYPNILCVLDKLCRDNYKGSLSKKGLETLPEFFLNVLQK